MQEMVELRNQEGAKGPEKEAIVNLHRGMQRLAMFVGTLGAIAGVINAYKVLHKVPSERYQHKVFERLAASDVVRRDYALFQAAQKDGVTLGQPLTSDIGDPREAKYDVVGLDDSGKELTYEALKAMYAGRPGSAFSRPTDSNGIRTIFWKPDLSVNFFVMQDGGEVDSSPFPSAWLYLLWIALPALGFITAWGVIRGIGWVVIGFQKPKS
jgi:hypothetical protein